MLRGLLRQHRYGATRFLPGRDKSLICRSTTVQGIIEGEIAGSRPGD